MLRLQAAFAMNRIDPGVEARHWKEIDLKALPEPVESWGELTYVGSFRMTNPLPLSIITMKLVRDRESDTPVTMNSAHAKPVEIDDGRWEYSGHLEARCAPGIYDLVAVVGGTTEVGRTRVSVVPSKKASK